MMSDKCSGEKLQTPIDLVLPTSLDFMIPPHASMYLPSDWDGQWIRYRSTYSRPRRARLALHASWEDWKPWSAVANWW